MSDESFERMLQWLEDEHGWDRSALKLRLGRNKDGEQAEPREVVDALTALARRRTLSDGDRRRAGQSRLDTQPFSFDTVGFSSQGEL